MRSLYSLLLRSLNPDGSPRDHACSMNDKLGRLLPPRIGLSPLTGSLMETALPLMPEDLIALMREAIRRCELDLSGMTVLTEAASGAYSVTPVLAALAAAKRVFTLARGSRFGTVDEVARAIIALARMASVSDRIEILSEKRRDIVAEADIITNSGHVRPIDREMVDGMKPTAVIPLMYEAWELREADLDLAACRQRWIAVAGTNERHPAVDVFSFLGSVAARLLTNAGIALDERRVAVWCDNPFRTFLVEGLIKSGALVESIEDLAFSRGGHVPDAILVAMTPRPRPVIGSREAEVIANRFPGALVAQFWGDIDREALARRSVRFWPVESPPPGHQGIMLSSIGPEPVVRLQAGGLKVGEVMARVRISDSGGEASCNRAVAAAIASGFGQALSTSRYGSSS